MKNKSSIKIKVLFITLFLFISACVNCYSEDTSSSNTNSSQATEPSKSEQFWKDARRFEIISLGSMPFVMLDCSLVYSGYKCVTNNFDTSYFNIFSTKNYTKQELTTLIVTSASISLGIAVTDLVVNIIKRNKIKKQQVIQSIEINPIDLHLNDDTDSSSNKESDFK